MDYTKHDLSYNHATLDFHALIMSSAIACRESQEQIHKHLTHMYDASLKKDYNSYRANAKWLRQHAEDLSIAAETYATLKAAESRENLDITNKPDIIAEN